METSCGSCVSEGVVIKQEECSGGDWEGPGYKIGRARARNTPRTQSIQLSDLNRDDR